MRSRGRRMTAVALVVLVLAGCSSKTKALPTLDKAQLRAKLLTAADVGAGWKVDQEATDSDNSPDTSSSSDTSNDIVCNGVKVHDPGKDFGDSVSVDFAVTGSGFGTITESLGSASIGEVKAEYDKVVSQVGSCSNFTQADSGTTMSGTFSAITLTARGDDTNSFLMTAHASGITIYATFALVRKGNVALMLEQGSTSKPREADVDALVAKAFAKL